MMNSETKWLPDGFHFLGPTETIARRKLMDQWIAYLTKKGYSEVVLPAMDYSANFLNQIHPDESPSVLRYRDLSGREISPGTDLTIQVVKGMAGLSHLTENQNVFYLSKRIRDHRKRNASRREIMQLGAESLGSSSPDDILRILKHADEILELSQVKKQPTIVLGHNYFIRTVFQRIQELPVSLDLNLLSYCIHTKNFSEIRKMGRDGNLPEDILNAIIGMVESMDFDSVYSLLNHIAGPYGEEFQEKVHDLKQVWKGWNSSPRFSDLCIDLSLVRDLQYYTGFLFQGFLDGETEPVLTGGQYDRLYEIFSENPKRACGFAIHVDSLESSIEG